MTGTADTPRTVHAAVHGVVTRLIGDDRCTNAAVAAALNLHTRTLLRRLRAEGTSFRRIKDEVRREAMLYYLQRTDVALSRISERLGFSEQSAMTRRCRCWFGAAPSRVRAASRGSDGSTIRDVDGGER